MQEQGLLENGEYIIICVDDEVYDPTKERQYIQKESEITNNDVLPFRAVLVVTHRAPINPEYEDFKQNVTTLSMRPPFIIPTHPYLVLPVPLYAGLAYDAVLIYAKALTEALANNSTEDRGTDIINYIRGHVYQSIHGFSVRIDENGDAEGNFAVLSLLDNPNSSCEETKTMQPVGRFTYQEAQGLPLLLLEKQIDWIAGAPPAGEPKCGFNGELCEQDWKMILIGLVTAALVVIAGIFSIRHYRYEQKMARMLWKVDIKDLILLRTSSDLTLQNSRNQISMQVYDVSRLGNLVDSGRENSLSQRLDSRVGFYKGNVVFIKYINKRSVDLTRSLCKELINIREMRHENINPVIGACVDPPNVCVLTLFCARGSLEDVLKNEDLDLDNMFIASLVADLIKGMIYLHETDVVSHGKLKSSNCLVDSRWVLQIADYGLHELKQGQEIPFGKDLKYQRGLLWRSPELLRMMNPPPRGTQKGDVYSFAIILYEIIGRKGPWGPEAPPGKFIIERVMNPHHYGVHIYRPPIDELTGCNDYILRCMQECWDEDPDARPDFRLINQKLRDMQTGLKNNIFDNMIAIMEKYAYNLEGLVQERTNQLMEEKKKTENLLLRMLPKPVAEQLKRGEPVEAEIFDCVTIYFSDIVGFTELSAVSTPLQVVDLLNDLYTCFDSIIGHYDVYKVETIGDAYMVVSGLPLRNGDNHAGEIASVALHLLGAIQNFEIRHRPGERLKLRIGVHSGPCVAGVVGLKMPRYCLFGDTVNTSSRMESTGKALKIHVSEACKDILDKLGGYVLQERGLIPVKGKGEMRTYWLVRKESDNIVFSCDSRSEETINDTTELHIPPTNNDIIKDGNGNTNQCLSVPVVAQQKGITPHPDFSWLISHEVSEQETSNSGRRKRVSQISNYSSCGSLFQDCKKNILREFRSNSRPNTKGYRSAPIISFRDRASCRDYLL
ncbi:guanylate cyclase 32E-like [Tachypleus tridentatus]|uniref:guanylate cyclase 32E-like n=1 Tax=Tachypleus tridentatus TaxID=6853 RepID=UPI003FD51CD1